MTTRPPKSRPSTAVKKQAVSDVSEREISVQKKVAVHEKPVREMSVQKKVAVQEKPALKKPVQKPMQRPVEKKVAAKKPVQKPVEKKVAAQKPVQKKPMSVVQSKPLSDSEDDGDDSSYDGDDSSYDGDDGLCDDGLHDDDSQDGEPEDDAAEGSTEAEKAAKSVQNKRPKTETRQESKKLRLERQATRPHNDTVQSAKKLWERVRRRDMSAEDRAAPMSELFSLLTGKFKELILKHDASRMVQTCVKYGSSEQRMQIAGELSGIYPTVAKSRYGKHIVKRLLQYCPSVRRAIVAEFRGKIERLLRHADASSVLEEIYAEYTNAREKNMLLLEFYGTEHALFQRHAKEETVPTLADLLVRAPEKREKMLKSLREALDGLVNKGMLGHSFVHRLMLEYAQHEEPAKLQDWISTVDEKLVEIVHTFEGARAAGRCIAIATAKQRKTILKSFKSFVGKIAREEYAHQVLLVAFAVVDDTVLLRSTILSDLIKDLESVLSDKHALRLVYYVLAAGSQSVTSVMTAQGVQIVRDAEAAAAMAGTSKKEAAIRAAELLADLTEPLSALLMDRLEAMIGDQSQHQLLLEAALALPQVTEAMLAGPFSAPAFYDSFDGRALLKRFVRRCSSAQAEAYLDAIAPAMESLVESEAAYVFAALVAAKPQLVARIPRLDTTNEHALSLYDKFPSTN